MATTPTGITHIKAGTAVIRGKGENPAISFVASRNEPT